MSLISVDDLEEGREVVGRVSWGMKESHDVFFGAFSLLSQILFMLDGS